MYLFWKCDSDCNDQIVIETTNENIHEIAMIKNWNLADLRLKGMKYDSAAAGEEKISGCEVNKVCAYSYQRIRNENKLPTKKMLQMRFAIQYQTHKSVALHKKAKCSNCSKIGHFAKVCRQKNLNRVNNTEEQEDVTQKTTEKET